MFYDEDGNPNYSDEDQAFYSMLGQTASAAQQSGISGKGTGQANAGQNKKQNGAFQWGPDSGSAASDGSGFGVGMGNWGP
jgi:hypothetical protein